MDQQAGDTGMGEQDENNRMGEQDGNRGMEDQCGGTGWDSRTGKQDGNSGMEDRDGGPGQGLRTELRGMPGRSRRGGPSSSSPSPPRAGGPRDTGGHRGPLPLPRPGRRPVPPPQRARSPPRPRPRLRAPPAPRPLTMSARAGRRGHGRHAAGGPGLTSEPPHSVTPRRRHDVTAGTPPHTPPGGRGSAMGGAQRWRARSVPRIPGDPSAGSPSPSTPHGVATMTPWTTQ